MTLEISCAFPPSSAAVEHAVLAEQLGFKRAWFYDSPALYPDVWVTLARVAERTERIELGPATLIPHLRHPMTQAAAIATLAELAPGRLAVSISTGFTGRLTMGQPRLSRSYFERYVRQLRGLLAGEQVEIDGALCEMLHPEGYGPTRPIDVPILVGASGPRGEAFAREIGADGVVNAHPGFEWAAPLFFGTVLDEGESPNSERAAATVAGGLAVAYHAAYARDAGALDALPGGDAWREAVERVPEAERHLAMHAGHLVEANEIDRATLDLEALAPRLAWPAGELRERLRALEERGATELMWQPMGSDIPPSCARSRRRPA
jgi:5,10-methylenetetrahydromethanopterin reductase